MKRSFLPQSMQAAGVVLLALASLAGSTGAQEFDLVTLRNGERVQQVLVVENTGDHEASFDQATASCDCLSVEAFPATLPSGAADSLVVSIEGRTVGRYTVSITLASLDNASDNRVLYLPLLVLPPDPADSANSPFLAQAPRSRNQDLYLSAAEVREQYSNLETVRILDVRDRTAYQDVRIPGAVPMAVQAARLESLAGNRPILLVDEGWGSESTERACVRLRDDIDGPVHILLGGMAAWLRHAGTSVGSGPLRKQLEAMPPSEFLAQRSLTDWLVICAGGASLGSEPWLETQLSGRLYTVDGEGAPESISQAVAEAVSASTDPIRVLLLVATSGPSGAQLSDAWQGGAASVYYVEGGVPGLTADLAFARQMQQSTTKTVTTSGIGTQTVVLEGGVRYMSLTLHRANARLWVPMVAWFCFGLSTLSAAAAEKLVRYTLIVENTTSSISRDAHLWAYAPLEQTAYQRCTGLEVSHPYSLETDAVGNRILRFDFPDLLPYQQVLVQIQATLDMQEEPDEDRGARKSPPLGDLYKINLSDADRVVPSFAAPNDAQLAKKILRWVSNHINYTGYDAVDRGAGYALKHQSGDCTEYMALMAALSEQNGIPARGVNGYVLGRSANVEAGDLHSWAEVYIDGRWWIADPLKKTFMERGSDYIALSRYGDATGPMQGFARFRYQGDGLKVRMQ